MSDLIISPNLFLETNELNRFKKFLRDDGYKLIAKYLTKSFGVAQNANNTLLKVSQKIGTSNIVVINSGVAFDSNLNAITLENDVQMTIQNTGVKQWIAISYNFTNNERGTVNISSIGSLSGIGTEFMQVLRGQPNFPTKVKLISELNYGEYEVVDVTSDSTATLAGSFVSENGLKYNVIGTFTPGFQPTEENKNIYQYDSCSIRIIESKDKPIIGGDEFILASIVYDGIGAMTVTDERLSYLFNYDKVTSTGAIASTNNPLASLRKTTIVNDRRLEIQFEYGYTIKKYELITTSTSNTFNVITGESLFLGSGNIPNDLFAGWLLLNRKNMKTVIIDSNVNKALLISKFDSSIIETDDNDFVIIPNYSEIEIEMSLSGTKYSEKDAKFYRRLSMQNIINRWDIPIQYLDTALSLRYRMISGTVETTPFQKFAVTQFDNIEGIKETLADSSLSFNVPEPEYVLRNYS